jgi:hypothetical protein
MRINIEIRNTNKFFYWRVKFKRKINLTNGKKKQKNEDQIKKYIYYTLGLKGETEYK